MVSAASLTKGNVYTTHINHVKNETHTRKYEDGNLYIRQFYLDHLDVLPAERSIDHLPSMVLGVMSMILSINSCDINRIVLLSGNMSQFRAVMDIILPYR